MKKGYGTYCTFLNLLFKQACAAIVGILTFISRINFMLILVEHEKSLITSWPGFSNAQAHI